MRAKHRLRVLLILIAASLIGLLAYFLLLPQRQDASRSEFASKVDNNGSSGSIQIKGFRRTVAEGARTLYELWASSATLKVATKEYSLKGILPSSTYFGEKGQDISLSADEGIYGALSDNLILRGNVLAMLSNGLSLKCDEIDFGRSSMKSFAKGLVVVTGEGIRLHGGGLSIDFDVKKVVLVSGLT
ncbi:LPS export ABC transporter periplasmic protein LptC, partial [bacterium]|nr:LPS export ABC transporter periplasmic protein LptC [bacterium]